LFTEAISRAVLNSITLAALAFLASVELSAQSESAIRSPIQANSNRIPSGNLEHGILTLHLELRPGDWYPEADTGPSMNVYAFAEEGKALQVPAPLIRVSEGTEIHVTLHNFLPVTAVVHGLHQHPGDTKPVVEVPSQETRELRFVKLNEAKSKLGPGAPKNTTVVYEAAGDSVKVTIDGTDNDGKPTHNEWTGRYDGKESDARSLKKIDDRTLGFNVKKGGKVTTSGRIVVSADGKSRTVTTSGTDATGKKFSSTSVYDKQ
jgi:hypothetical protein